MVPSATPASRAIWATVDWKKPFWENTLMAASSMRWYLSFSLRFLLMGHLRLRQIYE